MKFNENLKYLRKQANLTQENLAEQLNVSRQAITKWENGQSMPDIENLKELSYIFSIPLDNLVGDIESKSSLRIHKKINDIGWFIFSFVILYVFATISISQFIVYIFNNQDIIFPVVAIMIILGIILLTVGIKKWLNEKSNVIINMTETEDGKKERKKLLLKKLLIFFVNFNFIMFILSLPSRETGTKIFIRDIISTLILSIVLVCIIGFFEYKKLKKIVKDFNTKD